jgi:hypothetical protein
LLDRFFLPTCADQSDQARRDPRETRTRVFASGDRVHRFLDKVLRRLIVDKRKGIKESTKEMTP